LQSSTCVSCEEPTPDVVNAGQGEQEAAPTVGLNVPLAQMEHVT
jgi:hypothetical protein